MRLKYKIFIAGGLVSIVLLSILLWIRGQPVIEEVGFSVFRADLENGRIGEIVVRGRHYVYKRKVAAGIEEVQTLGIEPDQSFNQELLGRGVTVSYENEADNGLFPKYLFFWLPMVAVLWLALFFMRQPGNGTMQRFGKSTARPISNLTARVTFENVAGIDEARDELSEIVSFLKDPKRFQRLGGRIPKGVLLMGRPGCGKTLLARAIAGEASVPFFSISGSDFVEIFAGVGASRVRDLFEQGKKEAPCIIFIDEIDAVGRHRGSGLGSGYDEREQTLNQLLVEMDGFESNDGVTIIAATNRPDVLDPALLRSGRFDRTITVLGPDMRGREGILAIHTKNIPMASAVSLTMIARGTPGFSGADLENLVNEAALLAARRGKDVVEGEDFEEAKDKVLMGTERRSMVIQDSVRRTMAFHEAGHALAARLISETDPVHKVTIIPRGRTLGLTQLLPAEDSLSVTKSFAQARIAMLMGGRIAEEIIINELSSGTGQDLQTATDLARKMVCEWGMSNRLGPLHYGQNGTPVFLGRELARHQRFSARTAALIDEEVQRIVMTQYKRARALIESNLAALTGLAEKLLEVEVLDGRQVDSILKKHRAKGEICFA